jgi:hypothetical protein
MKIRERPPSTLKNIDNGASERRAGDSRAPNINTKKYQRRAPWEAVSDILERPPSMLRNIDGGPLRGADEDPGASTINAKKY